MSFEQLLSTTQAAQLVGRAPSSIRDACISGALHASKDARAAWWVREEDLLAWDSRARRRHLKPRLPQPRTDEVVMLLADWGAGTPEEVAAALGVHVGNARKYLAVLAGQGRARRLEDGQWGLIEQEAPLAS